MITKFLQQSASEMHSTFPLPYLLMPQLLHGLIFALLFNTYRLRKLDFKISGSSFSLIFK